MNSLHKETICIDVSEEGERIDVVLAQRLPQLSRSLISKSIKNGLVSKNNHLLKPKDKVRSGDVIHVEIALDYRADKEEPIQPENIPLNIVFEDEHLLIINKPAGLVVHPAAGHETGTLVHALVHHHNELKNLPRAGIVHRLDKDTTGLMIIAKTVPSHTALIRLMQNRCIERKYLVLVLGELISGGKIETQYGRHPKNRLKMSVLPQGKEAITHYKILERLNQFTLLEVKLMTGRTHQIRVHMHHIKHPIVGDPLYGGRRKFPKGASEDLMSELNHFKRQALHAYSLSFTHPLQTTVPIKLDCPLPDDFQHLLETLRAHDDHHQA